MEVAAALLAAEQVISTTIQGAAIAAYAIAQPTMPLKATLTRIATSPDVSSPYVLNHTRSLRASDSLQRFSHTLNVVNGKAFIFGGETSHGILAGNDMHILNLPGGNPAGPEYQCVPAIAAEGKDVPGPRTGHASCVLAHKIYVYGGRAGEDLVDQNGRVWVFDTQSLMWSYLDPATSSFPLRYNHAAVAHDENIIILGGVPSAKDESNPLADIWRFNPVTTAWLELPPLTGAKATAPPNLAVSQDTLYLITGNTDLESQIHSFNLSGPSGAWQTQSFPTNPMTPGPRPREGAGARAISTGYGRSYLLYILGKKVGAKGEEEEGAEYWSDMWTYQLPSSKTSLPVLPAALVKDTARKQVGVDSGQGSWAEVELLPPDDLHALEGKVHPGPRGYFATAPVDIKTVFLWGGLNAKGETEGDGWLISIK